MDIPLSALTSPTADIGNRTLLAKTLRLYPKINFTAQTPDEDNGYGIHIYRDISEQQSRPWLINEGQIGDSKRPLVLVDGRQMVEIASDSIPPATANTNSKLRTIATLDAKGGGRIFFGGNIYVKIIPLFFPAIIILARMSILSTHRYQATKSCWQRSNIVSITNPHRSAERSPSPWAHKAGYPSQVHRSGLCIAKAPQ